MVVVFVAVVAFVMLDDVDVSFVVLVVDEALVSVEFVVSVVLDSSGGGIEVVELSA